MRVILAHEPPSYRAILAAALRELRPALDIHVVGPEHLDDDIRRLAPALVVCSTVTPQVRAIPLTWIMLYPGYERRAEVSVAGRHDSSDDVDLDRLLTLLDETARLSEAGPDLHEGAHHSAK